MNYRLYSLTNFYLSSLQHGLQTAHVVSDLFVKYGSQSGPELNALLHWAAADKTIIILNGGNCESLQKTMELWSGPALDLGLPFTLFKEDGPSLNGALTAIGIILPESIWSLPASKPGDRVEEFCNATIIRDSYASCRLA